MAKRKPAQARTHRKITISLGVEVDERLGIEARRRGLTRSQLADALLGEQLRHIVVSIRSPSLALQACEKEAAA